MKMTEWFMNELDAEARRTRRALENVPEGRDDWKPHDRSMPLGRLAMLVAQMPSWVSLVVDKDELDLQPPGGGSAVDHRPLRTVAELTEAMDRNVIAARQSLAATNDDHLKKPWRLLMAGKTVSEDTRTNVLRDTFLHLAHHRGQLTVYLRLTGAKVPAIYGPSADDQRFD
jgi:DinB family